MSKKRRRSRSGGNHPKAQAAPYARDFTDVEEAFFRAGTTEYELAPVETFADLDEGYHRPPGFLMKLFSRLQPSRA